MNNDSDKKSVLIVEDDIKIPCTLTETTTKMNLEECKMKKE